MNLFKADRIMDRLNCMLDHAMEGKPIESEFDETKMSALETRLNQYLKMIQTDRLQMETEKNHVKELISDISHQTKTPIANILLYSQLLEESVPRGECRAYAQELVSQSEKLQFLIGSLVKTSRLETGMITVVPKSVEILPLLEQSCGQIQAKAEQKAITVILHPTDILVVADAKWTEEAVYNVLDNAVKYSNFGGRVEISAVAYDLFCRIDIRDEGMGIHEEEQGKIFTRFYRSPSVSSEEGVGIGLFLTREIIAKQGGFVKVSSERGRGSLFSIYLPIVLPVS